MSGTTTAMTGRIGWGVQWDTNLAESQKCGDKSGVSTNWALYKPLGTNNTLEYWRQHKALAVDFGIVEAQAVSDPEVGGTAYPTGAYKSGEWVAGGATIQPRLKTAFAVLLYGATGYVSQMGNVDVEGNAVASVKSWQFAMRRDTPANSVELPWLAVRKYVPGQDTGEDYEEIGQDCRLAALRIAVPQNGPIVATPAFVGRKGILSDQSFDAWVAADDFDSVPISTRGHIKIAAENTAPPVGVSGTEYPALGCTIDITNGITTPGQEMIIGDYHPDDYAVLARNVTITWVYKWQDNVLYRQIVANGGTGASIAWSPIVYTSAFELLVESPNLITGSQPYQLYCYAPSVLWMSQGSPRLAGNGMLAINLIGTVQEPSAHNYFELRMCSDIVTHQWEN